MTRATSRLAVLLAALVAAPAARAQLGIDLTAPAEEKKPKKKAKAEKADGSRKSKAPRKTAPARPQDDIPLPPPPVPAPAPAEASPAPATPSDEPAEAVRPAPRASRTQEGLSLRPLDAKASAAAKARLDAAKKLLDEKATDTAALAFDEILRDAQLSDVHDEARYQRAKALARMGLDHSALAAFDDILERGAHGSRFHASAMEWLFYVGRRMRNEQPLLSRVARYAAGTLPPAHADRFHYLLSKYEFERGRALQDAGRGSDARSAFGEARRLAGLVREEAGRAPDPKALEGQAALGEAAAEGGNSGDTYAKARFVDGLVLYAQGDDQAASEAFKDVVRLTNPKRNRRADPELRELAFLQLARIHYQNRQNRYAIFYYGKMPWGGERWLEGLWEASYAHYRVGDYEKTLGNLLTLQSPYFKDEYYPESYVLKAIVYYENCRYPEARQVLEEFSKVYEPVYEELTRFTGSSQTTQAYYELLDTPARGAMKKILKLTLGDQNVRRLVESIREVEDELDHRLGGARSEFRQAALGKTLRERLTAERGSLLEEAGARARAKLEYERDQLRMLLGQALRIQIEVSRKEREALEGSLAKGSQVEVVRDLKYSHAVSDEHLYWPYEGEFWRDELGTYSYTLTKGCKDRLPRSRTAAR